MSEVPDHLVKRGFWIDWSRGRTLGSTITVEAATGNILVAVSAILISLASQRLWALLVFVYHQSRADKPLADGFFRQQQALLRTLASPEHLLIDFMRLSWTWHGKAHHSVLRGVLPSFLFFIFLLATVTAGVFSSFVVKSTNLRVLVDSPYCGYPGKTGYLEGNPPTKIWTDIWNKLQSDSLEYMQNCYSTTSPPSICNIYVRSRLPYRKISSPCPFASDLCIGSGDVATTFDTGLLDSNDHFGINSKPQDRLKFRMKTTCAPVRVKGMYEKKFLPDSQVFFPTEYGDEFYLYYYGKGFSLSTAGKWKTRNFTVQQSVPGTKYIFSYGLSGYYSFAQEHVSPPAFLPLPGLRRTDADITVMLLKFNSVVYQSVVNDPVFTAHQQSPYNIFDDGDNSHFTSDFPIGAIGCAEQYQFCVDNSKGSLECSDFNGTPNNTEVLLPQANSIQVATINLFMRGIQSVVDAVDVSPQLIQAQSTIEYGGFQGKKLPDDQWKKEAEGWYSFVLSEKQAWITAYAKGSWLSSTWGAENNIAPSTEGEQYLCRSQIMRKPGGFANVSVFGIAFVAAISGVFFLADIILLKTMIFMKGAKKLMRPRVDRWIAEGVLQLQRRAYEAEGEGFWSRFDSDIPLTNKQESLPDLPIFPSKNTGYDSLGDKVAVDSSETESHTTTKREDSPKRPSRLSIQLDEPELRERHLETPARFGGRLSA